MIIETHWLRTWQYPKNIWFLFFKKRVFTDPPKADKGGCTQVDTQNFSRAHTKSAFELFLPNLLDC